MQTPIALTRAVAKRLEQTREQIFKTVEYDYAGKPLAAEPDMERRTAAIGREYNVDTVLARRLAENMRPIGAKEVLGAEAIQGRSIDFLPISFIDRAQQAARAVARITWNDGSPQGTGFLCGNGLFVTNHHVIRTKDDARLMRVEFSYEIGLDGQQKRITSFAFDPDRLFITDDEDGLDVTIIGLGPKIGGDGNITNFGWCGLSSSADKHSIGEVANIIQHPQGRHKEIVLRENTIAGRHELALHYLADTESGSSGSPVFNNRWRPIALHHWGGVHRWKGDPDTPYAPDTVNEGLRISAIVKLVSEKLDGIHEPGRSQMQQALDHGNRSESSGPMDHIVTGGTPSHEQTGEAPETKSQSQQDGSIGNNMAGKINEDGSATWTIPLEVSVRIPGAVSNQMSGIPLAAQSTSPQTMPPNSGASEALQPSVDFSDRAGYDPMFIDGFIIPLPVLSDENLAVAAINTQALPGENQHVLKYHHFSLVMHAQRRLAFYTACNTDGLTSRDINRDTNEVVGLLAPNVRGLSEGMERKDPWTIDPRIGAEHQVNETFYKGWFNDLMDAKGHKDMLPKVNFDRGHLIRRLDPAWGTDSTAKLGESDTFFFTNCAPQSKWFNRGKMGSDTPGKGKIWRAIENWVLRNAIKTDGRVISFTGPVFRDDDPVFKATYSDEEVAAPMRYWKVTVWKENNSLKSLALLADHTASLQIQHDDGGQESFMDDDELSRVKDFIVPIREVEALTGLDFGSDVCGADLFKNGEIIEVTDASVLPAGAETMRKPRKRKTRPKTSRAPTKRSKSTKRKTK